MDFIICTIIESIFYVLLIYFASFIIEIVTPFKLLIDNFKWEKSTNRAKGAAGFNSIFIFFLTNLVVFLIKLSKLNAKPEDYSFWKWFLIVILLTVIFERLYLKYTPKNKNKSDSDYSG